MTNDPKKNVELPEAQPSQEPAKNEPTPERAREEKKKQENEAGREGR